MVLFEKTLELCCNLDKIYSMIKHILQNPFHMCCQLFTFKQKNLILANVEIAREIPSPSRKNVEPLS